MALRVLVQPPFQGRGTEDALLVKELAQAEQIKHAEGGTAALEDVLITPAGFLHHTQGLLLFGDIAQGPDVAEQAGILAEFAAGHGELAGLAVLHDLDDLRLLFAEQRAGIQQQRIEARHQAAQRPAAGKGAGQAEHGLGLRVEVGQQAIRVADQHPFLDRAEGAGCLMQAAPRGSVEFAQAALLTLQAIQGDQGQGADQGEQQQLAGHARQKPGLQNSWVEQRTQLPVAALYPHAGQGHALIFGGDRHADRTAAGQALAAGEDALAGLVFQQPGILLTLIQLQCLAEQFQWQAQNPGGAAAVIRMLLQQQIDQPAILAAEGIVIRLGMVSLVQALDEQRIVDLVAVVQATPLIVQVGQAMQAGEDAGQRGGQLQAVLVGVLTDDRQRRVGPELQAQPQILTQMADVLFGAFALVVFQLLELRAQLPDQHAQHQQHQNDQRTLEWPAHRQPAGIGQLAGRTLVSGNLHVIGLLLRRLGRKAGATGIGCLQACLLARRSASTGDERGLPAGLHSGSFAPRARAGDLNSTGRPRQFLIFPQQGQSWLNTSTACTG